MEGWRDGGMEGWEVGRMSRRDPVIEAQYEVLGLDRLLIAPSRRDDRSGSQPFADLLICNPLLCEVHGKVNRLRRWRVGFGCGF
jgi:hypothetical protein